MVRLVLRAPAPGLSLGEALSLPDTGNLVEWKPGVACLPLLKKSLLYNKPALGEAELKDGFLLALCEA